MCRANFFNFFVVVTVARIFHFQFPVKKNLLKRWLLQLLLLFWISMFFRYTIWYNNQWTMIDNDDSFIHSFFLVPQRYQQTRKWLRCCFATSSHTKRRTSSQIHSFTRNVVPVERRRHTRFVLQVTFVLRVDEFHSSWNDNSGMFMHACMHVWPRWMDRSHSKPLA